MDFLVAGLGNPGSQYKDTRHNIGFKAVDSLADRFSVSFKSDKLSKSEITDFTVQSSIGSNISLQLVKPQTFMNDSGISVRKLFERSSFSGQIDSVIIIHDELDLPCGKIKIKVGGGLAGHNGLISIRNHLHTQDFLRIRVGIGRPNQNGADYVLSKPSAIEAELLRASVKVAADAVISIVENGIG
ncbi:MAG: aminoacyl-tRNA hydrolase, partial [Acidimicrobiales bacterium]|nr:aminoacyl-tRNA hydrolase [Acidimicrobiales bacterium]